MRKLISLLFLLSIFMTTTFAQKNIILEIGNQKISAEEFERIYQKNNSQLSESSEIKSPSEYMDMYINFKLKVIEAESRGMDTTKSFIDELAGYRSDLAKPYLTDVSYTDSMVRDAYYRTIKEVRASHILLRLEEDAQPADTLKVYEKLMGIRQQFLNKEKTFNELATEYSEDPSAATNGGDLGYFRAFQMVTPFENAAYNTKPGEVSFPVRSRFGYHLIYTQDLRDAKGDIHVAHIMKIFSNQRDVSPIEEKELKAKIDSIYTLFQNGADFGELAQKYSDDKRSAVNNGDMSWINSSFGVPSFIEAAYNIKADGEISEVIRTNYGWHIIKRIEVKPLPSFEEKKEELTTKVKSDPSRSQYSKTKFLDKLKKEYGFSINSENISKVTNYAYALGNDSMSVNLPADLANLPFFTLAQKTYTSTDYANYVATNSKLAEKLPAIQFARNVDKFEEETITSYEDSRLESKYPDFRYLAQEYHDGILLFSIMEEMVWNKAMTDSVGLEYFYQNNAGKYKWGVHFNGLIISCKSQEVRDKVEEMLESGETNPETIKEIVNVNEDNLVTITKGKWEKGDNKIIDYFVWNLEKPDNLDETMVFIHGDKLEIADKTLDEARGLYISDYQDYLEKEWLKELHAKYPIVINKKLLKKVKNINK